MWYCDVMYKKIKSNPSLKPLVRHKPYRLSVTPLHRWRRAWPMACVMEKVVETGNYLPFPILPPSFDGHSMVQFASFLSTLFIRRQLFRSTQLSRAQITHKHTHKKKISNISFGFWMSFLFLFSVGFLSFIY